MKIVQITTAHVQQGEEPDLFGLDEQGNVYIYRRAIDPWVTKEYQPPPVLQYQVSAPELLADIEKCIHNQIGMDPRIEQFGQGHSYADKIQQPVEWLAAPEAPNPFMGTICQAQQGTPEWLTAEQHRAQVEQAHRYHEAALMRKQKEQALQAQAQRPTYKDVYHDGCTEGWEPLKMTISKTVPHKDDPTRCERC